MSLALAVFLLQQQDKDPFAFRGSPIHPACVKPLVVEIQDVLPTLASVDVEGCTHSDRNSEIKPREVGGKLIIDEENRAWFGYRHLGRSSNGIHALHTYSNGGGSGVFMSVLLVRLERDFVVDNGTRRERVVMKSVGRVGLGDRYAGIVELKGDVLRTGTSRIDLKNLTDK